MGAEVVKASAATCSRKNAKNAGTEGDVFRLKRTISFSA